MRHLLVGLALMTIYAYPKVLIVLVFVGSVIILTQKKNEMFQCRPSTINNPYGNLLYTSAKTSEPACPLDDNLIMDNKMHNLYVPSSDLYRRIPKSGQYIQTPSTVYPNEQDGVLNFIYNVDKPTCKENNKDCLTFEDVRFHK